MYLEYCLQKITSNIQTYSSKRFQVFLVSHRHFMEHAAEYVQSLKQKLNKFVMDWLFSMNADMAGNSLKILS